MFRVALTFMACLAATTAHAATTAGCTQSVEEMRVKLQEIGELPVFLGLTPSNQMMQVYAGSNGNWTAVMYSPQGSACIVAHGENWRTVTAPADPGV